MDFLPLLLGTAVLLPLASFFTILVLGRRLGKEGEYGAYLATSAIVMSGVLAFSSLGLWLTKHFPEAPHHAEHDEDHASMSGWASVASAAEPQQKAEQEKPADAPKPAGEPKPVGDAKPTDNTKPAGDAKPADAPAPADGAASEPSESTAAHAEGEDHHHEEHASEKAVTSYSGTYWILGRFGKLELSISYYIDSLTIVMFCMVTLIASCIHFYAMGYMHDELHDITDKEVKLEDGSYFKRRGRYHRFFQYLSLFCFSMLGLVLAGNIAMVFCFWELVGICSYFLIGFYIERKSASTAANKAFIVNRVGDFGMIIGLMALWSALGTFNFGDQTRDGQVEPGLFSLVRPAAQNYQLQIPDGMVVASAVHAGGDAGQRARDILLDHPDQLASARSQIESEAVDVPEFTDAGYWLLIVAGVGIFCGCVGKSAQFPLHVWLPDAMEGPTPVSALVHSATMVAAGVYLVGRFYPVFAPEVLVVIACVGAITLFVAATIAITANDIKRVLAYSTVSQLGYMMLALGVGGWLAGLMHLVTHAFFKSLLFMCSGSVIHAVHTNDMREMGGLLRKMPVTAITMLIGCLAIAGVGVPFVAVVGFSGFYSKDAILEQAYSLAQTQSGSSMPMLLFVVAAGGAAITAFYMFRMWYLTFIGTPRNRDRYDHAHESPAVMYMPLVILSVFAVTVAWDTSLIGYGIVPVAVLIVQGMRRGWFRGGAGDHGHGDDHGHGHDSHGHDSHGHDAHAHDAHGHDSHGHDSHPPIGLECHGKGGHAAESVHCPAEEGLGWTARGIIMTIAVSLAVGFFCKTSGLLPESGLSLKGLLSQSHPAGLQHADVIASGRWIKWTWPNEHLSHADSIAIPVTMLATGTWIIGISLATALYCFGYLKAEDVRRQFSGIYTLLVNKWWFDELYDRVFVRPTHVISEFVAGIDKQWIDALIDGAAAVTRWFSVQWERLADQIVVDGFANGLAAWTYKLGDSLRNVQTGRLRQYVMFIVLGAIAIFILVSFFWSTTLAR